jgi:hypothetical protein
LLMADNNRDKGTTQHPIPCLPAACRVVCRCVLCQRAREMRDGKHQHLPPTAVSTCSQGGLGATGHIPQLPQHWHTTDNTTCPHPHKQLLVRWIMGGMAAATMGGSNKGGG